VFAIRHQREILHERIEQRVGAMFDSGLIDEVNGLLEKHGELSHTAAQAVGYREVIEHLNGQHTEEETRELVLIRTRRFARHQETWFRNLSECRWVELEADFDPQKVASEIVALASV
jgi:tRNA dimethylallyltransferase